MIKKILLMVVIVIFLSIIARMANAKMIVKDYLDTNTITISQVCIDSYLWLIVVDKLTGTSTVKQQFINNKIARTCLMN